jgi:hypothetical protein
MADSRFRFTRARRRAPGEKTPGFEQKVTKATKGSKAALPLLPLLPSVQDFFLSLETLGRSRNGLT